MDASPRRAAGDDQPTRKQRITTSENIDQNTVAFRIVQKGGGLSKFAADFDFPTSTVFGWLAKRPGREPPSGLIPSRTRFSTDHGRHISYQAWIMHRGRMLNPPVEYSPEEFVEPEPETAN